MLCKATSVPREALTRTCIDPVRARHAYVPSCQRVDVELNTANNAQGRRQSDAASDQERPSAKSIYSKHRRHSTSAVDQRRPRSI